MVSTYGSFILPCCRWRHGRKSTPNTKHKMLPTRLNRNGSTAETLCMHPKNGFFLLLCSLSLLLSCGDGGKPAAAGQEPGAARDAGTERQRTVLIFGNSLTAGYGLDNPSDAFPALIQKKIDS